MNGPQPDPAQHTVSSHTGVMPAKFWDFHARYDRACLEYSRIHLGSADDARRLVDATFLYLATLWPRLQTMPNPGGYAWALFKERVHGELAAQGRQPATTENLAFARAIRAATEPLLTSFRTSFQVEHGREIAELEEGMGLYRHMARLSERQFDILVLRDALGFTTKETALIMGTAEATVRSVRRTAKQRIATAMGYRTRLTPQTDTE
ncbi:sigma-70 family RNA polymerase sigma factor [Streptomyces fructofermentans]|uniref:sigma-70 family RNA polymerase sigma factor n=1 Tax=Streptomyces fructofermentans TaxID=152141 RepID=UPI0033C1EF1B